MQNTVFTNLINFPNGKMRAIYILFFTIIFLLLISFKYENYSYKSFRWVNISNDFFAYNRIWYQNKLILKTCSPKVKVDISLIENGIIEAEITVKNGYSGSFWYKYYSVINKKWTNSLCDEYVPNSHRTQFLDIDSLNKSEQDRFIFETILNKFESYNAESTEYQMDENSILEVG